MRIGLGIATALILTSVSCHPAPVVAAKAAGSDPAADPKTVRLDFTDRPVSEVVEAIAARGGYEVVLDKDVDRPSRGRLVSLTDAERVPFWEALERLNRAAGLDIVTERGFTGPLTVQLAPLRGARGPVFVSGLFRCQVLEVAHQRVLALGPEPPPNTQGRAVPTRDGSRGPDVGPTIESLRVRVQVRPEPRGLMLQSAGVPRILRAVDDRGRDMTYPAAEQKGLGALIITGGIGAFVAELPLAVPDPPGQVIRTLQAVAPVNLAGRDFSVEFTFTNIPLP